MIFDPEQALAYLEYYAKEQRKFEQDRLALLNSTLPQGLRDEQDVKLKRLIGEEFNKKLQVLADFARFPPFHDRHFKALTEFHNVAAFDASVFIMTKYPEPKSAVPLDVQLAKVIETVQGAIKRCTFTPRLAMEKEYYPGLWDNVELFLLGCRRGVAIVEDRYKPELNPNVAMEWGWMRGLGRDVLYLVEQKFGQKRADWSGLIEHTFAWDDPAKEIVPAVHKWLGCTIAH